MPDKYIVERERVRNLYTDVDGLERTHDLSVLLSSPHRDFLIRSNGDQVKISSLVGKIVCIFFYARDSSYDPLITDKLIQVYSIVASSKINDFEVVAVFPQDDETAFNLDFARMPWLAVPHYDSVTTSRRLKQWFVAAVPDLAFLSNNGKVSMQHRKATVAIRKYGALAYPFDRKRMEFLDQQEAKARENQSLASLLVSGHLDYLIDSNGNKVRVSQLVGNTVGLYIRFHGNIFTTLLNEVYKELVTEKGERFEVVQLSPSNGAETVPWLALPSEDRRYKRLYDYFDEEDSDPRFVIIGPDGKTLNRDGFELIEEYGAEAFPFTPEKLEKLEMSKKHQSLESLLAFHGRDYLIGKNGRKVPVAELVGKNILFYVDCWNSLHDRLVEVYYGIKEKDADFELIFVNFFFAEPTFENGLSDAPWLAIPCDDFRHRRVIRRLKVPGAPSLLFFSGSTCHTLDLETIDLVMEHGADAYPFTKENLRNLRKKTRTQSRKQAKPA